LSKGAKAALGEVSPQAQQGAEEQVYLFWHGRVEDVVTAFHALDRNRIACLEEVWQSPTYFETRKSKMDHARLRQEGYLAIMNAISVVLIFITIML
jgi:hypothetical protein